MAQKMESVLQEIVTFSQKHQVSLSHHIHQVHELKADIPQRDSNWAKFEKMPGVYCILNAADDEVKYIGMSQVDTGTRLIQWLFPKVMIKDSDSLPAGILSDDFILSVVINEHYMAPALESYLIARFSPIFNKKK